MNANRQNKEFWIKVVTKGYINSVPKPLVECDIVTDRERSILEVLCDYLQMENEKDNYTIFAKQETIARRRGKTRQNVNKILGSLYQKQFIQPVKGNIKNANQYIFINEDVLCDYFDFKDYLLKKVTYFEQKEKDEKKAEFYDEWLYALIRAAEKTDNLTLLSEVIKTFEAEFDDETPVTKTIKELAKNGLKQEVPEDEDKEFGEELHKPNVVEGNFAPKNTKEEGKEINEVLAEVLNKKAEMKEETQEEPFEVKVADDDLPFFTDEECEKEQESQEEEKDYFSDLHSIDEEDRGWGWSFANREESEVNQNLVNFKKDKEPLPIKNGVGV